MNFKKHLFFPLLFFIFPLAGNAQCPTSLSGYTLLGEYDNSKYFMSNSTSNWNTAKNNAAANGGYLASITSQGGNDFILSNLNNNIVFIGYNDAQSEGNFAWDSGESVGFDKFSDTNSPNRDYGKMNFWNGNWGVDGSNVSRKSIVEFPCEGGSSNGINITSCPNDIDAVGNNSVNVSWNIPTATTDCSQGGLNITKIQGPSPGTILVGNASSQDVVYEITDACGNSESCIFTITVNPPSGGGGGNCPDNISGFITIGEFGDSKYFLSNSNSQPAAAQAVAASNGGYLAVINSQAENNFIQQNIDIMSYIGLNDVASEGNLQWVNGEALSYNNVNPCGFCESNSGSMDYVIMAP